MSRDREARTPVSLHEPSLEYTEPPTIHMIEGIGWEYLRWSRETIRALDRRVKELERRFT